MLISRWLRVRSQTYGVSAIRKHHHRHQFHSTPSSYRDAPSRSQVIQPLYVDTVPPSPEQLHASEVFFKTHLPTKSWTATEWRQRPHSESNYLTPEVAFLGRSNSGKSSLLNGLLFDDKLCRVGAKPGKTITMHAWSLSPVNPETKGARKGHQGDMEPKLTVLDMPGYGHGSHGEWGAAIMKYLTARRQLRRAFVLVNPLHGLKEQDLQMLELLRGNGIPHQMIACKADRMKPAEAPDLLNAMQTQIDKHFSRKRQVPLLMTVKDILTVGGLAQVKDSSKWLDSAQGLHDIRWAILRAAGLEDYVMMLAANGGSLPKTKQSQSVPIELGTLDDGGAPLQPGAESHVQPQNDQASAETFQDRIGPDGISSVGLSAEDIVSDMFNPMSDHPHESKPKIANNFAKYGAEESVVRPPPVGQRDTPSQQRSAMSRTAMAGSRNSRACDAKSSKIPRKKDVKRYGVRGR